MKQPAKPRPHVEQLILGELAKGAMLLPPRGSSWPVLQCTDGAERSVSPRFVAQLRDAGLIELLTGTWRITAAGMTEARR